MEAHIGCARRHRDHCILVEQHIADNDGVPAVSRIRRCPAKIERALLDALRQIGHLAPRRQVSRHARRGDANVIEQRRDPLLHFGEIARRADAIEVVAPEIDQQNFRLAAANGIEQAKARATFEKHGIGGPQFLLQEVRQDLPIEPKEPSRRPVQRWVLGAERMKQRHVARRAVAGRLLDEAVLLRRRKGPVERAVLQIGQRTEADGNRGNGVAAIGQRLGNEMHASLARRRQERMGRYKENFHSIPSATAD